MEFQRAQFKEWGGFDTNGTDGPVDFSRAVNAADYRFIVIEAPSEVPIIDVNGHRDTHSVTTKQIDVDGGRVPAMDLDGRWAVAVWPANDPTAELFAHAHAIDDKEDKLSPVQNIDLVRWLRPEQVKFIAGL